SPGAWRAGCCGDSPACASATSSASRAPAAATQPPSFRKKRRSIILLSLLRGRTRILDSMWNNFRTDTLGGIVAGVSMMTGGSGNQTHTYIARPDGAGPYPGVVMTHHLPGWDEFYREFARRFAEHGYIAIVPNLFDQ